MTSMQQIAQAYGLTYDEDGNSKVSGGSGNDKIVMPTSGGVDYAYGGAGNDTFMFKANFIKAEQEAGKLDPSNPKYVAPPTGAIDKVIWDFEGAGVAHSATGSDFLSFQGYDRSKGASFELNKSMGFDGVAGDSSGHKIESDSGPKSYYYTLHSQDPSIADITIMIKSMNGKPLDSNDYNFYA